MPKEIQFRRGDTNQNNNFKGAEGELSVNLDTYSIRVHNGITTGGFELARNDLSNVSGISTTNIDIPGNISATSLNSVNGNFTGIVTSPSFIGNLTGIASTAIDVIGGIGSLSSLNVSGITTTELLQVGTGGTIIITTTPSGLVGIGTLTPTSKLTVEGDGYFSGNLTASSFTGVVVGVVSTAEKLENTRTFEITGDIVASPQNFNGTQNVSLASSIQPNTVGLGTHTYGDYVKNITGTVGEIEVNVTSGEGVSPQIGLPNDVTISNNLTVNNDLQVGHDLNVNGNITVGGTTAYLIVDNFIVKDRDIVTGYTTGPNGTDNSSDITANTGGIAVASTEGSPLVNLNIVGIETLPPTYKKLMWFKEGSFAGLNTDAWLFNYGVGIGSTQIPNGVRLAVGGVQITELDVSKVRNINASGIITSSELNTNKLNVSGISTLNYINSININSSGIVTATQFSTGSNGIGINTNTIFGPEVMIIDPAAVGDNTGILRIKGDLYVDGTQTYINSTSLEIADLQIGIGTTAVNDIVLDGAGIGVGSTPIRKTFVWEYSTSSFKSSENINLAINKTYKINGIDVLTSNSLGSGITSSVLTSVGTLNQLNVSGISTLPFINSTNINASGIITASTFRPSSGYIQAADGTNSFYIYGGTGNVAFQGTIGASQINNASGYKVIGFAGTDITFENNAYIAGVTTSVRGFVGNLTGIASTATNLSDAANITTGTINSARLSGTYNIDITGSSGYATTAGTATYAINSGIATYSNTSGISTYSSVSGIATYATSSGISTYSNISGIATYSTTAGISTYSNTSGVSTSVIGGIGSITSLNVSGISTLGTVQVSSGIITATSGIVTYYGDGSKLTNIISSIGIQLGGVTIGTGITTINFAGIANSITVSGSTATIRNVLSSFSNSNFSTPTAGFSTDTVPVSSTVSENYIITGLSPFQLVNVVGIASGGTLTTPSVLIDGNGNATGTLTFTAGITSYPSGVNQTISFISNNTTVTKNWNINIIAAPGDTLVFGWDQVNDLYGWYQFGQTTKLYDIAGNESFIDLSVHSRMRRCVINDLGVVQYYLDADNSGFRSGDWLRIVERQTIGVAYTGTLTESTNSYLRLTAPAWSAGTYTLGQRVTYNGSIWECVVASTTATPAAGSVSSDLTGGAGQVMVEIPAFSVGHAINGNIHTFGIKLGTNPPAGYEVHPAFIKSDGSYRSYIYVSAYHSSGISPATSISGVNNRTNATRATFRTAATARGTGWHQLSHYEYSAIQFLLITEFQSVNSQRVLGNGAQEGSVYVVNTGLSNPQGNRSQNRYTVGGNNGDYVSYRGLENVYGRAWQWSDGINVNGNDVYLNRNWNTWVDDNSTNYTLVGNMGVGSITGSYITNFLNLNNVLLPSSVTGGNSTSRVADGLYTSTGWRASYVGGASISGALGGVFCFFFFFASSVAGASVGGRLCFAPV